MNRDRFRFGFGGGRRGSDKLFTGQRQIAELGIYHYNARFYSPKLGRFLSADTIVPRYANPQNLNRFSYVTNNPLRYTDPTGHRPDEGRAGQRGCTKSLYCTNGQMKSKQELASMRRASREAKRREIDGSGFAGSNNSEESWRYSTTISAGAHLGPTAHINAPDYDDDSYNGMPFRSGPYDYSDNFFISFNVEYNSSGIGVSDMTISNQYVGVARIDAVRINKHVVYTGSSYLKPSSGSYASIPGTGGRYDGKSRILIDVAVSYLQDVGHGPDPIPYTFDTITLPTLAEFTHMMQTGGLP